MRQRLDVALVLLILFAFLGVVLPEWTIFLLTMALAKGLVVLGVVLLMQAGLVSFGQGLFYGASAYALAFAMHLFGLRDAFLLTGVGMAAGALTAALGGLVVARYREIFFAMLTLAFGMAFWGVLQKATSITGGDDGMGIPLATFLGYAPTGAQYRLVMYFYTLACTGIMLYLVDRYLRSPLGYVVRAIRDNEVRVEYLGMSVAVSIYVAYLLAGGLAGLGGVLAALNLGHITPDLTYWATSGEFVTVALLGGTEHALAPLIGAIAYEFLRSEAASRWPEAWQLLVGVTMLAVILFMPRGLWTLVDRARGLGRVRSWTRQEPV